MRNGESNKKNHEESALTSIQLITFTPRTP